MMRRRDKAAHGSDKSGFTLIELVIVILIIGILAAFGMPAYFNSVETSKADDAVSLVTMAGTTHRMYALDHSNAWLAGTVSSACTPGGCGGAGACEIVRCRYLASQDYDNKPYSLTLVDGTAGTTSFSCNGASGTTPGNLVAFVCRRAGASPGTSVGKYQKWGYGIDLNGKIGISGGAPTPVQG